MAENAQLHLTQPVGPARDAIGYALAEQGFTVRATPTGALDVERGSMGTTLVAGAFAGHDMHVRFAVVFAESGEGTVATFEHSTAGGFFKGGAIGAVKARDVVREAAHATGVRLAQQGLLIGAVPAAPEASAGAPVAEAPAVDGSASAPDASAPAADAASGALAADAPAPPAPAADAPVAPDGSVPPPPPVGTGVPAAPVAPAPPAGQPAPTGVPLPPPGYGAPSAPSPYGAPPAPPYATAGAPSPYAAAGAIPPPVDYANRTNVVAIIALVLGFIVPLGGIIAGAVGLAQIKRTGEKGRGLAIGGIIAGSVLTLASIVAVVSLIVIGALAAAQDDALLPPGTSSSDDPGSGAVFNAQVGQCFDDLASGYVAEENVLPCSGPHYYEAFAAFPVDGAVFPGDDEVDTTAQDGCAQAFATFVGVEYGTSTLDYSYVAPRESEWEAGDRRVVCFIFDPAGDVTGTLQGANR